MASPSTDWAHCYPSAAAESTVVSTGSGPGPGPTQPVNNIEGRVGKTSARRRTRASRRAPTTLLNTDPTNFRAMVQQFTGAPACPYTNPTGPVISFGPQHHHPHQAPVASPGQFGPHPGAHHQQHDWPVIVAGGNVTDGFLQGGFNYSAASNCSSTNTTTSSGFFFDGMLMGGNINDRNGGGYFL